MISSACKHIFERCIHDYHLTDDVNAVINNPFPKDTISHLLYHKNWIDTIQWHLEDIIRNPSIEPATALAIKRRIDISNQERTDVVEYIDNYFLNEYKLIKPRKNAHLNTESPAWAIDRLSILALKIYHMEIEANREEAGKEHRERCKSKLDILLEQRTDLSKSIDDLLNDIALGNKSMKVYRQMKMYNDPGLNPVLYKQQPS
jgi:hypothetical protein